MIKYFSLIFSFIFISFNAYSKSSYDDEGEYLMPQALMEICDISVEEATDGEALKKCLETIMEKRKENLTVARDTSNKILQEYIVNYFAGSASAVQNAGSFQTTDAIDAAKGGESASETSEFKEEISKIILASSDGADRLSQFLHQYSALSLIKIYQTFHENNVLKEAEYEDKTRTLFNENSVPEIKYEGLDIDPRVANGVIPEEYSKLAANCTKEIEEAKTLNQDVVVALNDCFVERRNKLAKTIQLTYDLKLAEINKLKDKYEAEYQEATAKIEEEVKIDKKMNLTEKRDELARKRKRTIRSKINELNSWYEEEMDDITETIKGGG